MARADDLPDSDLRPCLSSAIPATPSALLNICAAFRVHVPVEAPVLVEVEGSTFAGTPVDVHAGVSSRLGVVSVAVFVVVVLESVTAAAVGVVELYAPDAAVTGSGASVLIAGSELPLVVAVAPRPELVDVGTAGVTCSGAVGPAPGAPERLISSSGVSFQTLSVAPALSVTAVVAAADVEGTVPGPELAMSGFSGTIGIPV